jgi:hypothetical protein
VTTSLPIKTPMAWHLAERNRIRAFRAGRYLLILAEGDLPTAGYEVDIELSPLDVFPPQYQLLRRERVLLPRVVVPYRYGEVVIYPEDQPTVTVDHADGQDEVNIETCGQDLADFAALVSGEAGETSSRSAAAEAIGMSRRLSFDEAFANALANLPPATPPHPDALTRVQVVDTSGLFGGLPGFHHLVVRVRRTTD